MNAWFTRTLEQLKALWGKWTSPQKIIFLSVIGAALLGIILLIGFSSAPSMVPLITTPITDQNLRDQISLRLDQEGVTHTITPSGIIMVKNEQTARAMRMLLFRENLVPKNASPWDVFQMNQWTTTDFERNVNLQRAITKALELHIEAIQGIDSANVSLVLPQETLFKEDQNPVSASIILTPSPGSDITSSRSKIEGIQKLVKFAVPGLKDENIVITDNQGNVLNNFANLEPIDRLDLAKREIQEKLNLENQYREAIQNTLGQIFGSDRVRVMKVDIELDMSKKTIDTTEHFPVTIRARDPTLPYDNSEVVPHIVISQQAKNEKFEGTGFNPEGPPGQEGQTPPAYKDLSNLVGKYSNQVETTNYDVNTRKIQEVAQPYSIKRVTVGVAIDGTWQKDYDAKGNLRFNPDGSVMRTYTPVSADDLKKATALVENAIGYSKYRGDSVTVQTIEFDRTAEFAKEDAQIRNARRLQEAILYSVIGLALVLVAFVIFRLIAREVERRRRLREEELSRQHQAMREAALRAAEEEGVEVQMSVEERARLEMQENAINMAREHPEDVAQLIRTWLVEE